MSVRRSVALVGAGLALTAVAAWRPGEACSSFPPSRFEVDHSG